MTTVESTRRRPGATTRRRSASIVAIMVVLAVTLGGGTSLAGSGNNLVRTLGDETLVPNVQVHANLKFSPGKVRVASGETLAVEHADKTEAPHTLTIVEAGELPQTFEDLFDPTFCATCNAAFAAHDASGPVVDGGDGFNAAGDSIFFAHGDTAEIAVTAESGTVLPFICIIHPWMQGTIVVP